MKLSIVVAAYNVAPYLNRLLIELVKLNAEIIVIDDGSTDGTKAVGQSYGPKVNVISVENGGLGRARNIGLSYATGDYIWFVDGDDLINVKNMMTINCEITENPDLVVFGWQVMNDRGQPTGNGRDLSEKSPYTTAVWNKYFKTSWLKEQNIKFPEGVLFEDMPFSFETFHTARSIQRVPMIGYYYRQRPGSITLSESGDQKRLVALEQLNNVISKYSGWQANAKLYQMVMGNWWYHVQQMSQLNDQLFAWYREWQLDFQQFTDLSYQMNWAKQKLLIYAIHHKNTDLISDLAKRNNKAVLRDMKNILMRVVLR